MPEKVNDRTIFLLSEVTRSIQNTLSERYPGSFWVKAEMNKLNHYPQSGHCYPDLVEKAGNKIIAEIRSTIWKDDYQQINDNFLKVLHEPLKNGINILFSAKISFHPLYGLSLRILDIDPSFSLGELEKEKQETIEKIRKEGIYNSNKSLKPALLPKRIAIISATTSKGYSDYLNVIDDNTWGYHFFHMLFPAHLQGENAIESITSQLMRIKKVKHHFDVVAIIRGGGGEVGLACYNNYELSKAIALFPIPVLTGIGHSTNETVAEMVAFKNAITPTELADWLIQQFHNFAVPVQKAQETIVDKCSRLIRDEKLKVMHTVRFFKSVTVSRLIRNKNEIQNQLKSLILQAKYFIQRKKERHINQNILLLEQGSRQVFIANRQRTELAMTNIFDKAALFILNNNKIIKNIEKNIDLMNPVNVLNRGYSITMVNEKVLKTVDGIKEGVILKTVLPDGNIISITSSMNKTESS
jgi:exodeoxyribonuclease VII large subunit